jgi:hypothetical protein
MIAFIKGIFEVIINIIKFFYGKISSSLNYIYTNISKDYEREKIIKKIKEQRRKQFKLNDEI